MGSVGAPVKIVGFCEDHGRVAVAEAAVSAVLGGTVSATRSQAYHGGNDILMFARSGTSIAMGNASDDVKALAGAVTTANDEDGFARAMHEIVLPTA